MTEQHENEYQPRTVERLIEILRAKSINPRSWAFEAAAALERLSAENEARQSQCEIMYKRILAAEARLTESEKTIVTLESNARIQATLLADTGRERDGLRARLGEAVKGWHEEAGRHERAAEDAKKVDDGFEYDLHYEAARVYRNCIAHLSRHSVGGSADTPSSVDKNSAIHKTSSI